MVSLQTVFTYPCHYSKLQILLHGVTANSLYLSFSPCKATNLSTWCHRKQSLLYPFHRAKLQILVHGVTANRLYEYFSPCKATNLTYDGSQSVIHFNVYYKTQKKQMSDRIS